MNSDKKVNDEQGINVLLRDISKILFPNNPVNVPVIKGRTVARCSLRFSAQRFNLPLTNPPWRTL